MLISPSKFTFQTFAAAVLAMLLMSASAQTPSAPKQSGSIKSTGAHALTLASRDGQDYVVNVPDAATLLEVAPGSKDLKSASPIKLADIAAGDQAMITGSPGDSGSTLTARRIIIMKSSAIAADHTAAEEAWVHGASGLVKSVNANAGTVQVSTGSMIVTVQATPTTKLRRYAGDSVRFEDAISCTLADVNPGDQLRARGTRSVDGATLRADEIITGTFQNLSGLLTKVDGTAGTVTLKDLATKKMVTVKVTDKSDLRRLPPQAAARFAARAAGNGVSSDGTTPGSAGAAASGPGGSVRAAADLSGILSRLPTETLGTLKVGDAVMIVASGSASAGQPTAVTLLAGVEPILQAAPEGEMHLAPWNVGGSAGDSGTQ